MAQVAVLVNGKRYLLACSDGEEAHLTQLAEIVDNRIKDLRGKIGAMDDSRMLLMAALILADELGTINSGGNSANMAVVSESVAALNQAASDIETIADTVANA